MVMVVGGIWFDVRFETQGKKRDLQQATARHHKTYASGRDNDEEFADDNNELLHESDRRDEANVAEDEEETAHRSRASFRRSGRSR